MLYRLRPPATLEWTDFPGYDTFQLLLDYDADLDRLEWQPTEVRTFSPDMLAVALRYGEPSTTGIVLDAQHAVDIGRADELRRLQQESEALQAEISAKNGAFFEAIMPGWTESGKALDERIRESTEDAAREAEADLDQVLAVAVKPELADHWRRLGGYVPREDA